MTEFFRRNSPPGMDLMQEWKVFVVGNVISALIGIFVFLDRYRGAYNDLFLYFGVAGAGNATDVEKVLRQDAVIVPFHRLWGASFFGFYIVATVMLCFIIFHYAYFRQGSMSVYLMKRLPNQMELHRRALTVPCLGALGTFAVAAVTALLCYIVYLCATPKGCLPYTALQEIWR